MYCHQSEEAEGQKKKKPSWQWEIRHYSICPPHSASSVFFHHLSIFLSVVLCECVCVCVCVRTWLWAFGALGSVATLRLPLTPCSGALGSHHRLYPKTTPPFLHLSAPPWRSGKHGVGWAEEQRASLTLFTQMMRCRSHSNYTLTVGPKEQAEDFPASIMASFPASMMGSIALSFRQWL